MSVMVECEKLPLAGSLETLMDWTIIGHPPITIHNSLKISANYLIWERSGSGLNALDLLRQQWTAEQVN